MHYVWNSQQQPSSHLLSFFTHAHPQAHLCGLYITHTKPRHRKTCRFHSHLLLYGTSTHHKWSLLESSHQHREQTHKDTPPTGEAVPFHVRVRGVLHQIMCHFLIVLYRYAHAHVHVHHHPHNLYIRPSLAVVCLQKGKSFRHTHTHHHHTLKQHTLLMSLHIHVKQASTFPFMHAHKRHGYTPARTLHTYTDTLTDPFFVLARTRVCVYV